MKKKKAIVTYYQKKYNDFLEIVLNRFKAYAKKCNVDFLEYILEESSNPVMDKFFHIGEKLPKYEQYLILDVDILIRKDAPNLFEIVPVNKLGMYNEACCLHKENGVFFKGVMARVGDMRNVAACKLPYVEISSEYSNINPFIYFNSGVIVHNRDSLELHQGFNLEQKSLLHKHVRRCGEQTLLNYCIRREDYFPNMYCLPVSFNQMPHNREVDYLLTTYFSHYAGMTTDRSEKMLADNSIWESNGY